MADCSEELLAAVATAAANKRPLYIRGGDSKRGLLGRECDAEPLDVGGHSGIIDYQPGELVITARAGTPLRVINGTLADEGQALPCDPPEFDGRATLGGTVASNLSGPARPWCGALRDLILGVKLINGRGQLLRFGGQVMKNVAGYDVSRLQAGALGSLGLITEVSCKVLPGPEHTQTLRFDLPADVAVETMNRRAGEPKPLSGACWIDGALYLRLAGTESAVRATAQLWGGEQVPPELAPWSDLRDMKLPFFDTSEPLWRLSINATAGVLSDQTVIDWCGAQRWLRGEHLAQTVREHARAAGGHAVLFRGGDRRSELRMPALAVEKRLQINLKQAFDPERIFNPGRLYSWL